MPVVHPLIVAAVMGFDLESYSRRAERFVSELDREYHLHFSGQQAEYRVQEIYDRHREPVRRRRDRVAARGPGRRERRRTAARRCCWSSRSAAISASPAPRRRRRWRGSRPSWSCESTARRFPTGGSPPSRRTSPIASGAQALQEAAWRLLAEQINPLHLQALEKTHSLIAELGWASYAEACAELRRIDLRRWPQAGRVPRGDRSRLRAGDGPRARAGPRDAAGAGAPL